MNEIAFRVSVSPLLYSDVNLVRSLGGSRGIRSQKFWISSEKNDGFQEKFRFFQAKIPMTFFSLQLLKVSFSEKMSIFIVYTYCTFLHNWSVFLEKKLSNILSVRNRL